MLTVIIIWENTKYTKFDDVVMFDMHKEKGKEVLAISRRGKVHPEYYDLKKIHKFRVE